MLETLYADFTSKVLPAIQQGLVITKDYFTDLFGRYVKYLIVSDSIFLGIGVVTLFVGLYFMYKLHLYAREVAPGYNTTTIYEDSFWPCIVQFFAVAGIIVGLIPFILMKANHVIQDIYIPEVRVYQELKPMISK